MARLVRAATDRNPPTLGGGGCQWGGNYYDYYEASTAMEKRVARAETVEELSAIIPPLDLYLEKGKCVARNRYDPSAMTPNLTPDKDTAQDKDRDTAPDKDRGKSPGAP